MRRALELAALGGAAVRPNPLVGCVITDAQGRVLAEGWHQRYGGPHAEVHALAALFKRPDAPASLAGLRVFVTLEPCAHQGKTPPCANLLAHHHATEVLVATTDPNPLVAGQGIERLRAVGCHVTVGLLGEEARWQNRRFFTNQQYQRPWVVLKWAQSADGLLAGPAGGPTPISGEATRRLVHRWRTEEAAILVGAGTARADNPHLDARHWPGPAPVRVVLTGQQPLPPTLHLLQPPQPALCYAFDTPLPALLADLYRREVASVLVEGGATVLRAFIAADQWDEIRVITAPLRLMAGLAAPVLPPGVALQRTDHLGADEIRYYRRAASC